MKPRKASPRSRKSVQNASVTNGLTDLTSSGFGDLSGLGTPLTQLGTLFKNNRWYLFSNNRQLISETYVEHGIFQTIVNVPVDDAMRGGIEIKSSQISPEQVEMLQQTLERQDYLSAVVGQAHKWNRLYGGAAILILTDQDPSTAFIPLNQGDRYDFRSCDMWELYPDNQAGQGYNMALQDEKSEFYQYYGVKLHHSRVIRIKGLVAPSFIRPRLRGWGFSVGEALVNSINQYLKSNNLCFEVLDEFKIDYYKIKNLTSSLSSGVGTNAIQKRLMEANRQKNFQHGVVMDAEDDFQQKQLNFTGIADILKEIRMQIASDMRMPLSKIFGISAAGFSSGEDDIENYNSMVESTVRSKCKYEIIRILEIMCQAMFGFTPEDLQIEFKPLRVLSSVDEETIKTSKFARLFQSVERGYISVEDFQQACNKENLYGIQVEVTGVSLLSEESESSGDDEDAPEPEKESHLAVSKQTHPAPKTPESK